MNELDRELAVIQVKVIISALKESTLSALQDLNNKLDSMDMSHIEMSKIITWTEKCVTKVERICKFLGEANHLLHKLEDEDLRMPCDWVYPEKMIEHLRRGI